MTATDIVFFEGGYRGGSVNRLLTLLDNWSFNDLRPSLVSVFSEVLAKRLLAHKSLVESASLNWPIHKTTEPFLKTGFGVMPTKYFITYFTISLKYLLKHRKSLVYYNNTPHMHIPSIFCAVLLGHKMVCHLRDTVSLTKGELFVSKWIDCFIVLSHDAEEHYRRQLGNSVRIDVVYDGIDIRKYGNCNGRNRQNRTGSVAVCVGTLSHRKGQDLCLKALSIVIRTNRSARLVLAGSGEAENSLRALAKSLLVDECVQFIGHVSDIPAVLAEADIGILASRREGMPNSVMEYMAASLPVIVTELNGIKELVQDGRTGYIVPQEDYTALASRWIQLLDCTERRVGFGSLGRTLVENGSFSLAAEKHGLASIMRSMA